MQWPLMFNVLAESPNQPIQRTGSSATRLRQSLKGNTLGGALDERFFSNVAIILGQLVEPILPPVLDRCLVHLVEEEPNPIGQLFLGVHSDASQDSLSHSREEALNEVEPRAMLGREDELEPVGHCLQVGSGLLRDMGAVVVEHHANPAAYMVPDVSQLK